MEVTTMVNKSNFGRGDRGKCGEGRKFNGGGFEKNRSPNKQPNKKK